MTEKSYDTPCGSIHYWVSRAVKKRIPSCFCQVLRPETNRLFSGSWRILLRAALCWCGMRRDMDVPGRSGWIYPDGESTLAGG